MGLLQDHALGERSACFVTTQTVLNDITAKPATTDAMKIETLSIEHSQETKPRTDAKQTRSLLERIDGRIKAAWSMEKYLLPSGVAGTPPDDHLLWKAVMGDYTPGATDVYSLKNTQQLDMLRIDRQMNGILGQVAIGALVEEMTLSMSGGDECKLKFSGPAMLAGHTGTSTLSVDGAGASMTVQPADAWNFNLGSLIAVGTTVDLTVIGITDRAAGVFELDATIVGEVIGAVVKPHLPSETIAGSPLTAIDGKLNLDGGDDMVITAFDVTVKNNNKLVDDESFQTYLSDAIPQDRVVTGNISCRARKDQIIEIGKKRSLVARDIVVEIGKTAGAKLQIDIDYALIDFAPEEVPTAGEVMIKLPFTARGNTGEDEIKFTFV